MTVNSINDNKIRVTLSYEERFRLFGEIDSLSLQDPSVRMALRVILKKIKYEYKFLSDCSKVYIDLYKGNSGGFIIYLTKQKSEEKQIERTFLFLNYDNLLDALGAVKRVTSDYRIFTNLNKFYLQIGKDKSWALMPLIEEFEGSLVALGNFEI